MIPSNQVSPVTTNAQAVADFTIGDSQALIEMLSTKIYSNKIGSFIREICTNAIDANIASGRSQEPISIEIDFDTCVPSRKDFSCSVSTASGKKCLCSVSISDSGLGMSPELIKTNLAVLGQSTKNHDNQEHGGFGVGFLTTLAVSQNIEIVSRHQGWTYHYRIEEQDGQIGIYLLSSTLTPGVKTGTTVSTIINRANSFFLRDLRLAIGLLATTTTTLPILTSKDNILFEVKKRLTDEAAYFRSHVLCADQYFSYHTPDAIASNTGADTPLALGDMSLVVMLGEVAYPFAFGYHQSGDPLIVQAADEELLPQSDRALFRAYFRRFSPYVFTESAYWSKNVLILKFAIGELEVSTSRETLALSDHNKLNILRKLSRSFVAIKAATAKALYCNYDYSNGLSLSQCLYAARSWELPCFKANGNEFKTDDVECIKISSFFYLNKKNKWTIAAAIALDGLSIPREDVNTFQLLRLLFLIKQSYPDREIEIILIKGDSRQASIASLLKKHAVVITSVSTVVIDCRDFQMTCEASDEISTWAPSFGNCRTLVCDSVKKKTFNTSRNNVFLAFELTATQSDLPNSLPNIYAESLREHRVGMAQAKQLIETGARVFYLSTTDVELSPADARVIKLMKKRFKVRDTEFSRLYVLSPGTIEYLRELGVDLQNIYQLLLPKAVKWLKVDVEPKLKTAGCIPRSVSPYFTEFLNQKTVQKFIAPERRWLIRWMDREFSLWDALVQKQFMICSASEVASLGACLQDFRDTISSIKEYSHRQSSAASNALRRSFDLDLYDANEIVHSQLYYLFADVLYAFPVLFQSCIFRNDWKGSGELIQISLKIFTKDIRSGVLSRWRQHN